MIHVGVNLLWLVPGVVGGSEEYTVRLLGALADEEAADVRLTLFANRLLLAAHPELADRYEVREAPVSGRSKAARVLAESTWLPTAMADAGVDLEHHMGGILPARRTAPAVLTLHDLQPLAMPRLFSPAKRRFASVAVPRSVRAAAAVVTLTEFTREDLHRRLGIDPRQVVVIPPGFDRPGVTDPGRLAAVRRVYVLGDHPYFLYPAITYPHKNHLVLVRALWFLRRVHPEALLVLTGGAAQEEGRLGDTAAALGVADLIRRTGRIDARDLDVLYRGAAAVTFPSLFEGFGLPVLEAMSRDCPVIAASATALPEVVDDAGLLVAPTDPMAWASAMARVLDEPDTAEALREAGTVRSRTYRWPVAAGRLLELYRQVAARGADWSTGVTP